MNKKNSAISPKDLLCYLLSKLVNIFNKQKLFKKCMRSSFSNAIYKKVRKTGNINIRYANKHIRVCNFGSSVVKLGSIFKRFFFFAYLPSKYIRFRQYTCKIWKFFTKAYNLQHKTFRF